MAEYDRIVRILIETSIEFERPPVTERSIVVGLAVVLTMNANGRNAVHDQIIRIDGFGAAEKCYRPPCACGRPSAVGVAR
jgi:hypothetical protein